MIAKDLTREKCYNLFLTRLEKFKDESIKEIDEEDIENMAFQLEKGVFDKYSEDSEYRDQVRKILSNISHTPSKMLGEGYLMENGITQSWWYE